MATINATLNNLLHRIGQRARDPDGDLLVGFAHTRDEAAFEEIVRRHGPMVLAVCRRMVGHAPDAEDAFQATFLVFVRRAATIRQTDLLANWLCAVAYRTARHALRRRFRVARIERQVDRLPDRAVESPAPADWRPRFDTAFQRLPAKYREPMLLCELQGCSRADAARQLGLNQGTLSCRLARGRELLKRKLGPGFALGSAALAAVALPDAMTAAVRPLAVAARPVPISVLQLAEGVSRTMFTSRLKYGLFLTACVVMTGVGSRVCGPTASATPVDAEPPPMASGPSEKHNSDLERIQGAWTLAAAVHDGVVLTNKLGSYRWTVTGNQLESVTGSEAVQVRAKIALAADGNHKRIDFGAVMPDGLTTESRRFSYIGIYRFERQGGRETLTVCFAAEDAVRPTEFASERGSKLTLFTLARAPKPVEVPKPSPLVRTTEPRDIAKDHAAAKSAVAIIDDVPLTREEFADYLIRRYGADKLEHFVNLRILENACARKGITVTDDEIDAAIRNDLKTMNLTEGAFQAQVLKQHNKSVVEWREDVIRPRLLLAKLSGGRGEKDLPALFRELKDAAKPKLLLEK